MAKFRNSNIAWKIMVGLLLAAVLVMMGMRGYEWYLERKAHFVRYQAFGIDIPTNYSIHGIDVSKYQEVIDWESVKQMNVEGVQIHLAFIKATEGNNNEDR